MLPNPRQFLLSTYQAAIRSVNGRHQVALYLREHPYHTPLALIAIGKAASAMAAGAFDELGTLVTHALLITKQGHVEKALLYGHPIICIESAHPVPDASSLTAGQTLLQFIKGLPPHYPLLFLISGGTSALVEVLVPGVTLADLQRVNQWLMASGLDIHAINRIRKRLSAIKGGRLATYVEGHSVLNLLISDVPGDDMQVIGSGLLIPDKDTPLPDSLPEWLHNLIAQTPPLVEPHYFKHIISHLLTTAATARRAATEAASRLGYQVHPHNILLTGNALSVGQALAQQLCEASPGVHIWSSETTVQLPPNPGQGGRCQSLALAAACELAGVSDVYLLAAGTDGNDGVGNAAGALIDGGTLQRGIEAGLDAQQCLNAADAGRFLAASGDLIITGPTGTNVMDIIIGLKS